VIEIANLLQIIATHGVSMLLGLLVCLIAIGFFAFLGGSTVRCSSIGSQQGAVQYACVTGAAIFVATSWYALRWSIPIPTSIAALCVVSLTLWLIFRKRNIFAAPSSVKLPEITRFIVDFSIFYVAAYCLVPELMFDDKELPYRLITRNADYFHYANSAKYFIHLGYDNIAEGYHFREAYWVTPGSYYFLALLGAILDNNVLAAGMPLIHGAVALIGVATASLLRETFHVTRLVSRLVGLVIISGVFFQYVFGSGFIPQYVSSAVMMFGTLQLAMWINSGASTNWRAMLLLMLPYCFLTFYIYPAIAIIYTLVATLLVCGSVIQAAMMRSGQFRIGRVFVWWGSIVAVVFIAVGTFDPSHFFYIAFGYVGKLSDAQVGWPLYMLPFYSLLGIPGDMQASVGCLEIWILIGFTVIALNLYFYVFKSYAFGSRERTPLAQRMFVTLGAAAWLAYFFYYAIGYFHGASRSYQQWKMASYLPLLFSFIFFASTAHLSRTVSSSRWFGSSAGKFRWNVLCCGLAVIALGGNIAYRLTQWPEDQRQSADFEALRRVPKLGGFDDLYVHMRNTSDVMLVAYFVEKLRLHFLSPSSLPTEQYDPEKIDAKHPLLWGGSQCANEKASAIYIYGVGCLLRAPPLMQFDHAYRLASDDPPAIDVTQGRVGRAVWGSQVEAPRVRIVAYAAAEEVMQQKLRAFVNLQICPNCDPRPDSYREGARLRFHLGRKLSPIISLKDSRWVSIPYDPADWVDARPAKLFLDMDILPVNESNSDGKDRRPIELVLVAASLSAAPQGELVEMASEPNADSSQF